MLNRLNWKFSNVSKTYKVKLKTHSWTRTLLTHTTVSRSLTSRHAYKTQSTRIFKIHKHS